MFRFKRDNRDKFPKEYEKKFLRSRDWKFILLAVASLLIHGVSIKYLFNHYPMQPHVRMSQKLMLRFAERYLNDMSEDEQASGSSYYSVSLQEDRTSSGQQMVTSSILQKKSDFVSPATADLEIGKQDSLEAMKKNVSETGLLGLVHGQADGLDAETQDFYAALDSTSLNIKDKLELFHDFLIPEPGSEYSSAKEYNNPYSDEISSVTDMQEKFLHDSTISQSLSQKDIQHIKNVLLSHNPLILEHYRNALKIQPDLQGKLSIRFAINHSGKVTLASVAYSTLNSPVFENEILGTIRQWKNFGDLPINSEELILKHTYVFSRHVSLPESKNNS